MHSLSLRSDAHEYSKQIVWVLCVCVFVVCVVCDVGFFLATGMMLLSWWAF